MQRLLLTLVLLAGIVAAALAQNAPLPPIVPPPAPPPAPLPAPVPPIAEWRVTDLGAKADGIADDAPAINAAIAHLRAAGAGVITFPPGRYRLASRLYLQQLAHFRLRGPGATLVADPKLPIDGSGCLLVLNQCSDFAVEDLAFDARATLRGHNDQAKTIALAGCSRFALRRLILSDAVGDHVYVNDSDPTTDTSASADGIIEGCAFTAAGRNAISIIHAHDLRITANRIDGAAALDPQAGIDVEGNFGPPQENRDIAIDHNTIRNCAIGIGVVNDHPASRVRVTDNHISACDYGFDGFADRCQVNGNTFDGIRAISLGLTGSECEAIDNLITNGGNIGIYSQGIDNVIRDNWILDTGQSPNGYCIHSAYGKGGTIITGNRIIAHTPHPTWVPIYPNPADLVTQNTRKGVAGADGTF